MSLSKVSAPLEKSGYSGEGQLIDKILPHQKCSYRPQDRAGQPSFFFDRCLTQVLPCHHTCSYTFPSIAKMRIDTSMFRTPFVNPSFLLGGTLPCSLTISSPHGNFNKWIEIGLTSFGANEHPSPCEKSYFPTKPPTSASTPPAFIRFCKRSSTDLQVNASLHAGIIFNTSLPLYFAQTFFRKAPHSPDKDSTGPQAHQAGFPRGQPGRHNNHLFRP